MYFCLKKIHAMPNKFDSKQRLKIAEQLDKSLGPEYLSVRPGFGTTQLTYVEGWLVINIANSIFGFDGWSTEIRRLKKEYCDSIEGKFSVGYSCCCRVTLKDGTYKEDVGFGSSDNQRMKGAAIEKAKKEASTDAIKRALRQFGNALGNCCYDKDFIKNVQVSSKTVFKNVNFNKEKLLKRSDIFDIKRSQDLSVSYDQEPSDL